MNRITELTAAAVILAVSLAFSQIYHHDVNLVTTSPWADNSWHQIGPNCTVENGTLVIGENVLVEFYPDQSILVKGGGTIDATDQGGDPIIFTSLGSVPVPGYWHALEAHSTVAGNPATIKLTNCEIRYGGQIIEEVSHGPIWSRFVAEEAGPTFVKVCSCYVHNCYGAGVDMDHGAPYTANTNVVIVRDTRIDSCEMGINLSYPAPQDAWDNSTEIRRNRIDSCGVGMMIGLDNGYSNIPIKNNIITRSRNHGVNIWANGGHFNNNVIDSSGSEGADNPYGIYIQFRGTDITDLTNNIITNSYDYAIYLGATYSIRIYHNCFNNWGFGIPETNPYPHNVTSDPELRQDPRFVASFGDSNYYHLQWDSPCLCWGEETLTNSNSAQSQSDIGAYGGPSEMKQSVRVYDLATTQTPSH
jgi:hypothetical protein